jgi:hypothetical protein
VRRAAGSDPLNEKLFARALRFHRLRNPCPDLRALPPGPEDTFSGSRMRGTERFLSILDTA